MRSCTRTLTALWIAAVVVLSCAALVTAKGSPRMDPVAGGGETWAISPYEFAGGGQIIIRDQQYEFSAYTVVMDIRPGDDGTLHVRTSHTFRFGEYMIVTDDEAVADPTDTPGLYVLNSNMQVITGGRGRLHAHGFIDLLAGHTSFELRGAVNLDD